MSQVRQTSIESVWFCIVVMCVFYSVAIYNYGCGLSARLSWVPEAIVSGGRFTARDTRRNTYICLTISKNQNPMARCAQRK